MKKLLTFSFLLFVAEICRGLNFYQELIYVTIYEEEPRGSFVAQVHAGPGIVIYRLGGDAGKHFAINNTTGNITIQNHIDREVLTSTGGKFTVFASDDAGDEASATVHYWIIDINDHFPYFPHQHYTVTVGESIDVSRQIFSVTAQDEDLAANAEIIYAIIDGNQDGVFKLQDAYHCNVLLAKALDFESKSLYTLNISASNYKSTFSNWTILTVLVQNEDDLPARFATYEYKAVVREDAAVGTSVLQVSAADRDKLNAPVIYEIVDPSGKEALFIISASTGVISLNGTLDREFRQEYRLRVLARSTFHLPDHVTVVVNISDVNDNKPVFSNGTYSFTIAENAATGATVGQVKASDADQGNNATFTYSLRGGEKRFSVDPHTGVITVSGWLDREKQESYSIVAIAKETQSVEKYSSNITVTITVEDRNDNAPQFVESFYNVTLKEEVPSGTHVLRVVANDSDSSTNAAVTYSLVPAVNDHYLSFNINPANGSIATADQLDREKISEYLFTVKAEDGASKDQRRSSTVLVKVTLQDINDNAPEFEKKSYTVVVSEATNVNTTVLTVKATDKDAGNYGEIGYILSDGNIGDTFSIEPSSGTLRVTEYFDRENVDSYRFAVTAKDGGNKSSTVNITVYVSDVNDNSPQFTSPTGYKFSVKEGTAGLTVGIVKATDSDTGENAEISYILMSTQTSKSFRINSSTGVISTAEALDYEAFRSHLLIVQARDNGGPQSRRTAVGVSVNVTDVNDNVPEFFEGEPDLNTIENNLLCGSFNTTDSIIIRVEDFTPANAEIATVKAFDKDGDAVNAKIFYRIQGNSSEVFSIGSQTGVIRTNRQLKRREKSAYNLTVTAENSLASPKLLSSANLLIIVYDVSDQRPQFTKSEYEIEVSESVAPGTSVIQINVTNSEQAASKFVFTILYDESSVDSRKFVIEPERGIITTQGQLDRETVSNYIFKVQAKVLNTALPQVFSNIVPVVINVTDVDDNPLLFLRRSYRFNTSELSRVSDVIGEVKAVDKDKDSQSNVFYRITGGNDKGLFNISADLGIIYLIQTLEEEANATYSLVVEARDTSVLVGSRRRRASEDSDVITVTVEIQDENNNAPVFTQDIFIGAFYETEARENTVVAKVQAFDKDFAAYGSMQYSIVYAENPGIFLLASLTGEVTLFNPSALVPGKLKYILEVSAKDNLGKAPHNSAKQNASVHIFVLSESNKLSLVIGVHPEFAREKINEINSMLRNLSGASVVIKDVRDIDGGKSIIYFHAVDNNTLHVLKQEDFISLLLNKTDLINDVFKKWNIQPPSNRPAARTAASTQEFSAVIAAMLVVSSGIAVAGIIGIIVTCRKGKRDKTTYKTNDSSESSLPHPTAWYAMDIPGIEAFVDSKTDETPRTLRSSTKYTVQKGMPGVSSLSFPRTSLRSSKTYKMTGQPKKEVEIPSLALPRTSLRSSKTYDVTDSTKKEVETKETVALNHYGSTSSPRASRRKSKEICGTVKSVTSNVVTDNVENHENAGFDISQEEAKYHDRAIDVGDLEVISKSDDESPDKKEANGKERRVRFDLPGTKAKRQKRKPMGHVPDIIVITKEGANRGKRMPDGGEMRRAVADSEAANDDYDEHMAADITSVFDDARSMSRIGDAGQRPGSEHLSAVSDEEGTVVDI